MSSKAALSSMGLPHSGHSPGVRGRVSSSMVASTSTKGTCATTAPHRFGASFITAPISSPPAEPPEMLILPEVVKPPRQGSSIGVGMVFEESQWMPALAGSWIYDPEALVERFVPGRELTVGIVTGEALPVVEIVMDAGYYDYEAKYTPGGSRHVVPALLSPDVTRQCQMVALQAFNALGCRGFGRVDIRMTPEGEIFVLEMNNIPGFTATSLLPDAAAAAGIGFPDLCMRIMEAAQC